MLTTYPVTRPRKRLTWDRRSRCSESQVSRWGGSRPAAAALIAALGLVRPAAAPAQTAADSLAHRTLATRAELDSLTRVLATGGSHSVADPRAAECGAARRTASDSPRLGAASPRRYLHRGSRAGTHPARRGHDPA